MYYIIIMFQRGTQTKGRKETGQPINDFSAGERNRMGASQPAISAAPRPAAHAQPSKRLNVLRDTVELGMIVGCYIGGSEGC